MKNATRFLKVHLLVQCAGLLALLSFNGSSTAQELQALPWGPPVPRSLHGAALTFRQRALDPLRSSPSSAAQGAVDQLGDALPADA